MSGGAAELTHILREDAALYDEMGETQVIGSCLIRRSAFDEVLDENLTGEAFYKPAHELIFDTMARMAGRGDAIDTITVGEEMRRAGVLEQAGGIAYLHSMVQAVPTSANVAYYASMVRERWLLRRLFSASVRAAQMATANGEGETGDIIARALSMFTEIADDVAGLTKDDDDLIDKVIADLSGPKRYTPTPLRGLTEAIGGWRADNLYVVGARPSVGKTAVAGEFMLDAMRRGMIPIFFSMEMSKEQVIGRLLSNIGSVDGMRMLHHSLRGDDEANLDAAKMELRRYSYVIDERSGLTVAQMRSTIRSVMRRGKPVLPIVDYLQITGSDPTLRNQDRRVQVDKMAQDMKNVTRDLHVPMIALAQLSRGSEQRAVPQPTMSDLREAGNIEQAADTICLLHRDVNSIVESEQRTMHWLVAKARHGRVCSFSTLFEGAYSRVSDMPGPMAL